MEYPYNNRLQLKPTLVGYTASHMRAGPSQYERSDLHSGFVGGPIINIVLSPSFICQPAVVFAQRGGTYRDLPEMLWGGQAVVDELRLSRDYLELPILFHYRFAQDSQFSPSLIGGLVWGWGQIILLNSLRQTVLM